jgi:6-phosphogluconate dehydrogenase
VGLGVMGRNFALNLAEKGFPLTVFNRTTEKTRAFMENEAGSRPIEPAMSIQDFIGFLKRPRVIFLFVPAGKPVDEVIEELLPYLSQDDLVIDSGNSHFSDTDSRLKRLGEKGIHFMGMGVSGGEKGARFGPSLMAGGNGHAFEMVKHILEPAAAHVDGEPCVALLGKGSSGHYVKMAHNGIEYALMQLISESYDILRKGFKVDCGELSSIYEEWNRGRLQSFLMEITTSIFKTKDEETGSYIVDMILDSAGQKGTGQWTSEESMKLQVPAPTIDISVSMRNLSDRKKERKIWQEIMKVPLREWTDGDKQTFLVHLENALSACFTVSYAQGLSLLKQASETYDYGLDLESVIRVWRGGCIIRAKALKDMRKAFRKNANLSNILLDPALAKAVKGALPHLRKVVCAAAESGIPAPAMMQCLAYIDSFGSLRLPANLIQAQRDFFGAHTFERVDREGRFHVQWEEK